MNFEIWQQDIGNIDLANRNILTFGSRENHIFPLHPYDSCMRFNINTKFNIAEEMTWDNTDIRDIGVETMLFHSNDGNEKDTISIKEVDQLDKTSNAAAHRLYKNYHALEIHSPCYPNIDNTRWDSVTKALNQFH